MTYPTSDSSLTYVYKNIINPFYKRHEKVCTKYYYHLSVLQIIIYIICVGAHVVGEHIPQDLQTT